jgi:hypothetical protein
MLRTLWRAWKLARGSNEVALTDQSVRLACWTTFLLSPEAAWWRRRLELLQCASRCSLEADRTQHLEELAAEAERAAYHGNWMVSFKIVNQLTGIPVRALSMVLGVNGEKIVDEEGIVDRWEHHFAGVLGATLVDGVENAVPKYTSKPHAKPMRVDFDEVEVEIARLPPRKAAGPDGIVAELIRAGGAVYATFSHNLLLDIAWWHYIPAHWRGGRLANLWKKKGSPACCDDNRGLLVSDHSAKIVSSLMKERMENDYNAYVGDEQFGCTSGRGTAFANHFSRCFLDYCKLRAFSCCIIFVDLVKAFDFAIREILLGWRQNFDGDKIGWLMDLGLSREHARAAADEIDRTGGLLKSLGIEGGVVELVRSLHDGSWFRFRDSSKVLHASRGGRQGCKLGAVVFNLICKGSSHASGTAS